MMKREAKEQMEAANNYYRSYLLKVFSEKENWQSKKFVDLFNTKYGLSKPSVKDSYPVVATPKTPEINSKFVSYYLNISEMKKYFFENCDKAISQANFSASKLCEIQIPIPEKKTQDQIVALIQTAKTELMRVSEPLKSQLNAINQLPASILNEVFGQYQINS